MQEEKDKKYIIGVRIRQAVLSKGLKNKELAMRIGVTENYLSAVINGRRIAKKLTLLHKIAKELDVSIEWLMGKETNNFMPSIEVDDSTSDVEAMKKNSPKDNFSCRLRLAIELSGLKNKEVATRSGIGPVYLSSLVNGKRKTANKDLIMKLAQVTNVNYKWLLAGDEGYNLEERRKAWGLPSEEDAVKKKYGELLSNINKLFASMSTGAFEEVSQIVSTLSWEELYVIVQAERGRRNNH